MSTATTTPNFPETRDWYQATDRVTAETQERALIRLAGDFGVNLSDLRRYRDSRRSV